jgi:hypothetical protein
VPQFLATHVVRAHLTDASRVHVDRASYGWWKETIDEMMQKLFAGRHKRHGSEIRACADALLSRIHWQVVGQASFWEGSC